MADTVDLSNLTEYQDSPMVMALNVGKLKQMMSEAKHCIVFTGAGISTSAKIPDFRGPTGVWTRQAQGLSAPECVSLEQALPTMCHTMISDMVKQGTIKYIVSQNIDGLHRRSGVPRENLSELHGNCFLEICWNCGYDKEHTSEVSGHSHPDGSCKECLQRVPYFCHCTSNKCPKCKAVMKDSIIHFKENLPKAALTLAYENAKKADLCVVFGSSLTVSPACTIPKIVAENGGKVVIINLQKTPLDDLATLRMFAKTDAVCEGLIAGERAHPNPFSLHAGNTHQLVSVDNDDGNKHLWKVFVECDLENAKYIRNVEFRLHPTFSPSEVEVSEPVILPDGRTACFGVERIGWGTFKIEGVVNFKSGAIQQFSHALSFASPRSQQTYIVQP